MARTKIAIACQGGGSQTAFTAGVLKHLLETGRGKFDMVSVSGTSGGAVCAALAWYGIRKHEKPACGRLIEFWKDNATQNVVEDAFNQWLVQSMRLVNHGMMPVLMHSPSSPWVQASVRMISAGFRDTFSDFPHLLSKYIDFDEIAQWRASTQRPVLVIGAADVTTGRLVKFNSAEEPIRIEHLLASCAVPTLFPAVAIGDHAYWDGLFSDNPPVEDLIRPYMVGPDNVPEEIWLIKINPTESSKVPFEPQDILDRRNQMEGNISVFHQLDHLEMINDMILAGAFKQAYMDKVGVLAPIRIPKSFATERDKPYHIPAIELPAEIGDRLTYEDKIDRSARHIDWLIAQGETAATRFLEERAAVVGQPH